MSPSEDTSSLLGTGRVTLKPGKPSQGQGRRRRQTSAIFVEEPWWSVDLGRVELIESVTVTSGKSGKRHMGYLLP